MKAEQVREISYQSNWQSMPTRMKRALLGSLVVLAWVAVFDLPQTLARTKPDQSEKANFSGTWTLDLEASTSLEPLMNQIGASPLDRKYAAQTKLKATLQQTDDVLKVATRGPGFALDQTLYLDGRNDPNNLKLLGATSINAKTVWSEDSKQLVEMHQIRTKDGKNGQLTIKRYLADQGKTLVVAYNLKLDAEQNDASARQFWRKQD
ncbi:MAG TPA: hypothetical protein VE641_16480 [Chthoniobacterales bacterium]|jgi:hypothetical protein|nr:hypothetical protein [Chthoniobacterales bacterium]